MTKADTGTVVSDSDEQGEAAGAAKTTTVFTAYEVVKTKDPVTLEQAKAMAQKWVASWRDRRCRRSQIYWPKT